MNGSARGSLLLAADGRWATKNEAEQLGRLQQQLDYKGCKAMKQYN
jgi:hypothetical protein